MNVQVKLVNRPAFLWLGLGLITDLYHYDDPGLAVTSLSA